MQNLLEKRRRRTAIAQVIFSQHVSRCIGKGGAAGAKQQNTTAYKGTRAHECSHIISYSKPMASSIFEYAVSRPYPFRWFTPVAFIGGIIALVLFSLLNFLSTGYTQRYIQPIYCGFARLHWFIIHSIEYVTDPNATMSSERWLNRWPSYFTSQIKPSCQAEDIQVNIGTSLRIGIALCG